MSLNDCRYSLDGGFTTRSNSLAEIQLVVVVEKFSGHATRTVKNVTHRTVYNKHDNAPLCLSSLINEILMNLCFLSFFSRSDSPAERPEKRSRSRLVPAVADCAIESEDEHEG